MVKRTAAVVGILCLIAAAVLIVGRHGVWARLANSTYAISRRCAAVSPQNTSPSKQAEIESTLVAALLSLEARPSDISINSSSRDSGAVIRARLPLGPPMEWFLWKLFTAAESTSCRIADCFVERKSGIYHVFFQPASRKSSVHAILSRASHFYSATARLAVVIEHFSFDTARWTMDILAFSEPLTLAVMSAGKRSAWTAHVADQYRKEVVILLPMEPETRVPSGSSSGMIFVHDADDKIRETIREHMNAIPNFTGCANHLGLRALADSRVMSIVLGELKKHHAYFLEYRESRRSAAFAAAQRHGVRYAAINVRVPPTAGRDEIGRALSQAAATAQINGSIIVSLPPTAASIAALKEKIAFFKANGIQWVLVSDLAHSRDRMQTIF